MIVLGRKKGQSLLIGDDVKVTITKVRGKTVSIGVEAPRSIKVLREEIASPKIEDQESDEA